MDGKTSITSLIQPQSVAIVGISGKPGNFGNIVFKNLQHSGFSGKIYPVNPNYQEVNGIPCFPKISEIPERIDCAILCVPARATLPIIEDLAEAGGRAAIIFASGFAEADESGVQLQAKLKVIAQKHHLAICGPNCMGVVNFQNRFTGYSGSIKLEKKPGRVAAISQSGSVVIAFLENGLEIPLSCAISSGNEAFTTIEDYFDYFVEDTETDVIMAFVESFKNIPKLRQVAEKARSRKKPIIVIKIGRSQLGEQTVKAHTGALAGFDAVHDAFFKQYGIIRVNTLDEMFATVTIFQKAKPVHGDRVGLIAFSGGEAGLLADLADSNKVKLAALSQPTEEGLRSVLPEYSSISNPLDTGWVPVDTYRKSLEILVQEPNIDLITVNLDSHLGLSQAQAETYQKYVESIAAISQRIDKPLVLLSNVSGGVHPLLESALAGSRVPILQGTIEGLRTIRHFLDYSLSTREQPASAIIGINSIKSIPTFDGLFDTECLSEHDAKQVLAAYGIPVTREILADSIENARKAAMHIGYPVVLKVDSPDIQHKTEIGAVKLNIQDEPSMIRTYESMVRKVEQSHPDACINGVLVQEMVQTGEAVEIIVGVTTDPQFGKVVLFGLGGIMVESLRDVSMRLAPLGEQDGWAMLDEIRGANILQGVRGKPPADRKSIVDVLVKISQLACDMEKEISEIDINPLFVFPDGRGVVAADALIVATKTNAF